MRATNEPIDIDNWRQWACEDDDAPVLQQCKRCGFSDELDADGHCILCSQTAEWDS